MFPVEIAYLKEPISDYVREVIRAVTGIHQQVEFQSILLRMGSHLYWTQQGRGDILVFLTGREEIERALQDLADLLPT